MRSTFSLVTASAPTMLSIWLRRSSLASRKASKASHEFVEGGSDVLEDAGRLDFRRGWAGVKICLFIVYSLFAVLNGAGGGIETARPARPR